MAIGVEGAVAVLRIRLHISLRKLLTVCYALLFLLSFFSPDRFTTIAHGPPDGDAHTIFQMRNGEAKEMFQQIIYERAERDMEEAKRRGYAGICGSADRGYGDEVIDAARAVEDKGSTILRCRQRNSDRVIQCFGGSSQEARDFIMTLVLWKKKGKIMGATGKACGLSTPAHGTILTLPADEVFGLET